MIHSSAGAIGIQILGEADRDGFFMDLYTDCNDFVTNSFSEVKAGLSKKRKDDLFDVEDMRRKGVLRRIKHIRGTTNPMDSQTKRQSYESRTFGELRQVLKGYYQPDHP